MLDDSNGSDVPDERDPPEVHALHLLLCRTLWFDSTRPEAGFGLAGITVHLQPPDGVRFPFLVERFFVYFQLWGEPGEYRPRIRLVRVTQADDDEGAEIQLGSGGEPREFPAPSGRPFEISGLNLVDEFAFPIGPVPFAAAGVYEFQLWIAGIEEPVARWRIWARE